MGDENIDMIREAINYLAMGILPRGCRFSHENNGKLGLRGEMVVIRTVNQQIEERRQVSPCEDCSYHPQCEQEERLKPKLQGRIDTDNLETGFYSQENLLELIKIQTSPQLEDTIDWVFDPDDKKFPWIFRMIKIRIVDENLKIEITQKAYFLIMLLTGNSPRKVMFVLHKAGNLFEKVKARRWLINSNIVANSLFPFGFPTEKAFDRWWDSQKSKRSWSGNMVDVFPDEWRKI